MKNVRRSLFWVACVGFLTCLSVQNATAAAEITQAQYVTPSQFLRSLKQVSLTLRATDELVSDYLPREMVQDELAKLGITVRSNAPVALEVRLMHRTRDGTRTTTTFVGGLRAGQAVEKFQVHFLLLSMHFHVRGAVLRNDKFHVLPVAAASGWWFNHVVGPTGTPKELEANSRPAIRQLVAKGIADVLDDINSDNRVDSTPWPPAPWTEKERVQKNADLAAALRAPMDSSLILDLDVQPRLNLTPKNMDSRCVVASDWQGVWAAEFQRLKWTKRQQPAITVEHRVDCQLEDFGRGGEFFRTVSTVYLNEANVLFELDGKLFRKSAALLFSEGFSAFNANEKVTVGVSGEVFGRFTSALNRGTRDAPKFPGEELAVIASSSKGAPTGRLILGGDVRLDQGGWRYANGTQVPDTLMDSVTGGPPLRPKSQRPVTQAPVSTHIADIKSVLGAIKTCPLYTSASRENLLWSVMSPAIELDDAGVVTSRYVLSTRPGQGYAQGAAIANLSLAAAQIQDRGCKVVVIPCKSGRCVRFEENANPSLTFFVETTEQANRVLNALKVLAPSYPSGAGELRNP